MADIQEQINAAAQAFGEQEAKVREGEKELARRLIVWSELVLEHRGAARVGDVISWAFGNSRRFGRVEKRSLDRHSTPTGRDPFGSDSRITYLVRNIKKDGTLGEQTSLGGYAQEKIRKEPGHPLNALFRE